MEFHVKINATSIPYLQRDIVEDYESLKFYSIENEVIDINLLMLAAFNSNVISALDDDKDYSVMTEFTILELESLREFLYTGSCDILLLESVLNALGIDVNSFVQESDNEIFVKTELQEAIEIKEEVVDNHDPLGEPMDESDHHSVVNNIKVEEEEETEILQSVTRAKEDMKDLPPDFKLPKPLEHYIRAAKKPLKNPNSKAIQIGDKYYCDTCDEKFTSRYKYDYHHFRLHQEHLQCPHCHRMVKIKAEKLFTLHMFYHIVRDAIPCVQCGKTFAKKSRLTEHRRDFGQYHDDQCAQCPQKFKTYEDYRAHVRLDHEHWMYKCGYCAGPFKKEADLRKHVNVVHKGKQRIVKEKEKEFCEICGQSYSSSSLKTHMKWVHEKVDMKIPCPHCDRTVRHPYALKTHIEWHHIKDPCPDCGKLIRRAELTRHQNQWHKAERRFKCDMCTKSFTTSLALKDHKNTHTGEKPYKCKYCSSCFASAGTHAMHQKGHLGIKRAPKKKKDE